MRIEVDIPDGGSGPWKVESFDITEESAQLFNLGQTINGTRRNVDSGHYKRLTRNGHTIMSNTTAEIKDHIVFFSAAQYYGGDILINGLGLGVALKVILENKKVTSVTVIERSPDVIKLVAGSFKDQRVTIIEADALKYRAPRGMQFTAVWHDIWDDISSDNLPTMSTLHRKYGGRCDWQGSWLKETCKQLRSKEKAQRNSNWGGFWK